MSASGNDSVKLEIIVDDQGSLVVKNFKETVGKAFGDLPQETDKANKALGGTWQSMAKGALAAAGLAFSVQQAVKFLKDSVAEAAEADRVNRQLESSFRANGDSAQVLGDIYDDWASQMQSMTGRTDEEIKGLVALGNTMGIHKEQMREVVQGAIGLTTTFGGSMQSNLEAVAKAYQGQWSQAERLIPQLKDMSSESDKLALLQKKMQEGFTSSTDAMKGQAGYLPTVKNQWGDFKEAVGGALLTIFGGLKSLTDKMTGHAAMLRKLRAEQEAYDSAMKEAAKTHVTYASIIADEAIKEREAQAILNGLAETRKGIAEQIRKDKADQVAKAEAEALRLQEEAARAAAEMLERYGTIEGGLTDAGRDLMIQTMQVAGVLPLFTAETQKAAEEQEDLEKKIRELITAEGELTAVGQGVMIAMLQWAGWLPTIDAETEKNAGTTQKWSVNWKDANEVLQFAQSMVSGLTDLLGAMGIELDATGEAALQAASGVGQIAAGVISKNPLQIIQGVTQALTGLINLFKGDGVGEAIERENEWMELTKDQVEQIKELEKQYGDTHAATSDLLDQFISSADITADSFDQWAERLHGILSDLDSGKMTLQQTQAQIGDAFDALISKAQELGTEGSAALISFYEDLAARGIQVAEVQDYINAKLEAGADAYADLKDMIDSSAVAQEVFGDISVPIFEEMLAYRKKLAENDDLVKSIQAATTMMVSLTDTTRIDQKQFDQFSLSADKSFKALIKGGMNSSEAIKTMGPYLQRLQFLHEQYGFTIDANTQKILDQAKKDGVVIENKKTETQQIIDLLSGIAKALGADIPDALDKTARAATDAFGKANKAAKEFGDNLDGMGEVTWNVSPRAQGDYAGRKISAASGYYSPALSQDTVIQAHRGEEVSIVPVGGGAPGGRQVYLNVTINGSKSPEGMADALMKAIDDNVHGVLTKLENIGRA